MRKDSDNQRRPQVLIVKNDRIHPFRIEVAQEVLGDLRERLKNTRFSYQAEGANWALGTDIDYLKELVGYWQDTYDWRKHEAALNRFAHFKTDVDDIGIHFIHERGNGPNPFPIILTHGYPDSFYRFAKIIPMLTDPASFRRTGRRLLSTWLFPICQATVFLTNRRKLERSFALTTCGRS